MILWASCCGAEGLALFLALLAARRLPTLRILAALCAFALVADLTIGFHDIETGRGWGIAHIPAMYQGPWPFRGWTRAAYHLATALTLGWPALVAASAWRTFGAPRVQPRTLVVSAPSPVPSFAIVGAWLALSIILAISYPLPRDLTAPTLHGWEGLCVVVAIVAVVRAWLRERTQWAGAHFPVGLLVVVELAIVTVGPFAAGDPFGDWSATATPAYLCSFLLLSAYLVGCLWRDRGRCAPP